MKSQHSTQLKVRHSGGWARVYADVDGKDVSHLFYGPQKVQVGEDAAIRLAGIGGVGTDTEHRRKGLAGRVLAHALTQMRRDGYNASALFTSRRIVAHRLYRRHGFVDLSRRMPAHKLLDPPALAARLLSDMTRGSAELQCQRLTVSLAIGGEKPAYLRAQGGEVTILSRAPRAVDLALEMSRRTLLRLWLRETRLGSAAAAKLVTWSGDRSLLELLARAADAVSAPANEE